MKKKILLLILATFLSISLWACGEDQPEKKENVILQILTLNDTHGYLDDVMPKIASYVKDAKADESTQTIILSAGDMFQGTAMSNLTRGKAMVECMNEIGFDAMAIGNHEFDWTVDAIANFKDGDAENGEANFPFLAANIFYKGTDTIMEFAEPYTIIERGDLKIGVIGTIGETLVNSISASMVKDFEFRDPLEIVKTYTKKLRTTDDCDIVILDTHNGSGDNIFYEHLDGDYKIDAIVNGHTHTSEKTETPVPAVQASSNGQEIGEIKLAYNTKTNEITSSSVKTIKVSSLVKGDSTVGAIVDKHNEAIEPITQEVLTTFTSYFNRTNMAVYGCNIIKNAFDVDFAFVNSGGFRTTFDTNQIITYGDMIRMIPFDNEVKLVTLTGRQIIDAYNGSDVVGYPRQSSLDFSSEMFDDDKIYRVAAIDYIFDKTSNPFLSGQDIEITGIKFRDVFISDIKLTNNDWSTDKTAVIQKIEW